MIRSGYAGTINLWKVYNDYSGSEWILGTHTDEDGNVVENCLAKRWLNKYFEYTPDGGKTYPNKTSEKTNIRATAYLMDTEVWGALYAGEKAQYAIGSPPLEMWCESYKKTHPSSKFSCDVKGVIGYSVTSEIGIDKGYDQIYLKNEDKYLWLASPSDKSGDADYLSAVYYGGTLTGEWNVNGKECRPLVCLKSGVQIKKTGERVYKIVEEE